MEWLLAETTQQNWVLAVVFMLPCLALVASIFCLKYARVRLDEAIDHYDVALALYDEMNRMDEKA